MIELENLCVRAGRFSLEGIDMTLPTGQYGVLMGKTGSGKTTLLEAICGLKTVTRGRIVLAGRDVTNRKPASRGIGLVPQDGALFSTMSVREHLAFSLVIRRWETEAVEERVGELAALLGIEGLLERTPEGLSGGEAQRVALGRALANRPEILCLDEPLSALDDETRLDMIELLRSLQTYTGVTILHITHNWDEARDLADRVYRIQDGQLREFSVAEIDRKFRRDREPAPCREMA